MADNSLVIALAGNPNAGKTSVFNTMTGSAQHVGNYPGVTVEKKTGVAEIDGRKVQVVDLPGTYSLTAYSLEELVVRDFLLKEKPDVVIYVDDASNLERNLYLAVQFLEFGTPMLIDLNMMDLAEKRGITIDTDKLSRLLGVPVVNTVARSSQGIRELLRKAVELAGEKRPWRAVEIPYGLDLEEGIDQIVSKIGRRADRWLPVGPRWLAIKCLEGDEEVIKQIRTEPDLAGELEPICHRITDHLRVTLDTSPEGLLAEKRYGYISGLLRESVKRGIVNRIELTDKVDRVLTNRLFGPAFLLFVLYGMYQFVFWGSAAPVEWLSGFFNWIGSSVLGYMPESYLRSLVVSGVIDGVGGVLGFVPIIMFMFFAIAILEDSGYLARMAYILDRVLRTFGLHGNSVMSLIISGGISGGCAVPGVMAARTLKDPKARLATILTVPMMNCGAKIPVYAMLIAAFFPGGQANMMFALTIISWAVVLTVARILRWTILPGASAPFVMELPPYRIPTLKGLLIHTWERTWMYIKKAGTVILAISIVMWAIMTFPELPDDKSAGWDARIEASASDEARSEIETQKAEAELAFSIAGRLGRFITNITAPLGFDWRTNIALVGGFAAKEVVMTTMGTAYSLGEIDPEDSTKLSERLRDNPNWNPLKAFTLMIFVMIYAPCFVTVAVIRKEAGSWKWALFAVVYTTVMAYILALAVYQGGLLFGLGAGG